MKPWRAILAMLLCSALLIAAGLTACGDDDDEVDCAAALAQLQSAGCVNGVTAGINDLRTCLAQPGCLGDPVCQALCEDEFEDAASACEPAFTIIVEECGCQICGQNFEGCILDAATPATECVEETLDCLTTCVSS